MGVANLLPLRSVRSPSRLTLAWLRGWRGLVLPLGLLLVLELAVGKGLIAAHQLPAPSTVGLTLWELAVGGELWGHIGVSLARVLTGFLLGAGLALLVGSWVGLSRRAEAYLEPSFQALRAIPSLAWVPLLLLWLGIDETPKIVLIVGADRKLTHPAD